MIKLFFSGVIIGVVGTIAALYYVPAVDQAREASVITVAPNGGNAERFHVNIPGDRIMLGAQGRATALPEGMLWPEDSVLDGTQAELFKLRNQRDVVIGVASRFAVSNSDIGSVVEWVVHLPARGSLFAVLDPAMRDGGRDGVLRGGTGEFSELGGGLSERWVAASADGADGNDGRIELVASYVSTRVQESPDDAGPAAETDE